MIVLKKATASHFHYRFETFKIQYQQTVNCIIFTITATFESQGCTLHYIRSQTQLCTIRLIGLHVSIAYSKPTGLPWTYDGKINSGWLINEIVGWKLTMANGLIWEEHFNLCFDSSDWRWLDCHETTEFAIWNIYWTKTKRCDPASFDGCSSICFWQ